MGTRARSFFRKATAGVTELRRLMAHPVVMGRPNITLSSVDAEDSPNRLSTAQRLIDAYTLASKDEAVAKLRAPQDDLWTNLVDANFGELLQFLKSKDAEALAEYLLHFGKKFTWFGGLTLSIDGFNRRRAHSAIAISYLDKLICLAEAIGVLPVENPEQLDTWGENLHVDVEETIRAIENSIGIDIAPPLGAVPVMGIDTSRGPLHYRHFNSLYAAVRLNDILIERGPICEYGAGLGMVAFYANRLGLRDYTIFDLPLINVFAGSFLINTLGSDAVSLYGEPASADTVKVLPYWQCLNVAPKYFALSLNQDSFPEIDPWLVSEYLKQIIRTTTKYFLSINQESQAPMGTRKQNFVPAIAETMGALQRSYRMKYWIREGYVEELYEIRSARSGS